MGHMSVRAQPHVRLSVYKCTRGFVSVKAELEIVYAEVYHSMETKALKARLPLLWFDRFLRRHGPLLPLPIFAIRLATDVSALLSSGQGLDSPQGGHLRHHLAEAGVVYVGITLVRIFVYGLHCAGGPCSAHRITCSMS